MRPSVDRRRGGFTLMELVVTMIVISILGSVAIPNFKEAAYRADARKVLTDVAALRVAMMEFREDNNSLPRTAGWGTVPPALVPYLNNVKFDYKSLEYRLTSNQNRGRVDVFVRYSRGDRIAAALQRFSRPGNDSGSIAWNRTRTRFRLLENDR